MTGIPLVGKLGKPWLDGTAGRTDSGWFELAGTSIGAWGDDGITGNAGIIGLVDGNACGPAYGRQCVFEYPQFGSEWMEDGVRCGDVLGVYRFGGVPTYVPGSGTPGHVLLNPSQNWALKSGTGPLRHKK